MDTNIFLLLSMLMLESGSRVNAQNESVKMVNVLNNFGLQLHKKLALANENLACSGYAVAMLLNMLLVGAKTTTEEELRDLLGYNAVGLTKQQVEASFNEILTKLRSTDQGDKLSIESTILIQSGFHVLPEYSNTLRNTFYTREEATNFTSSTSTSHVKVLASSMFPKRKDPKILDAVVEDSSRLMLSSSMSFHGIWKVGFNKNLTSPHPFNNGNSIKETRFMNTQSDFNVYENNDVKVLELPYTRDELSMILVLPKTVTGLPDLEKNLDIKTLEMFLRNLRLARVFVQIPTFVKSFSLPLAHVLKSLGMNDSFTPSVADFTGIASQRGLYVSEPMLQLSVMALNEDYADMDSPFSTTRVNRQAHGRPVPTRKVWFTADHPFLYAIVHRPTGVFLVIGRMTEV